jgi:gluconolactonase
VEYYGRPRPCELEIRGVYFEDPEAGTLTLLADDFLQPNGLCFSPDERRLFVNDTKRRHIRVFEVNPDGTLTKSRVWAATVGEGVGAPDGMKVDARSNVYCTGPGGLHVFDPDGTCLGVIHTPELVANLNWGDTDRQSLYITASTSLYRARTRVPSHVKGEFRRGAIPTRRTICSRKR